MTLLLFARARDLLHADRIEIDVPGCATVGDLRGQLILQYPALTGLMEKSAIAVNDEFAADHMQIPVGAEVALLPPVSGG